MHDLSRSVNNSVRFGHLRGSYFHENFAFAKFHENKSLAKISASTVEYSGVSRKVQ